MWFHLPWLEVPLLFLLSWPLFWSGVLGGLVCDGVQEGGAFLAVEGGTGEMRGLGVGRGAVAESQSSPCHRPQSIRAVPTQSLGGLWGVTGGSCIRRCGRSPGLYWGAGKGLAHSIGSVWAPWESWNVWRDLNGVLQLFPRRERGVVCGTLHRPQGACSSPGVVRGMCVRCLLDGLLRA